MNKKLSTLLAGVALLGAMNANAGDPVKSLVYDAKKPTPLYQLESGGSVLAMSDAGKLSMEAAVTTANLANTLWCVEVVDEVLGSAPRYNFINKATGQKLDIVFAGTELEGLPQLTPTTDYEIGGEISNWAFSKQYKNDLKPATLYAYFKQDSVIGLTVNGTDVEIQKQGATDAYAEAAAGGTFSLFTLQEADMIRLDAKALNTYIGMQDEKNGVALTFNPDEKGEKVKVANPFNGKNAGKFFAEDAEADYVYVRTAKRAYLRVDNSLTNESGAKFRAFAWKDLSATADMAAAHAALAAEPLKEQYKFAFTFYPSKDSLVIQVKEALDYDDATESFVADANPAKLPVVGTPGEYDFVTVQDLIAGKVRIVTVDDKKETDINLGFAGCVAVGSAKVTLDEGLYFIRDAKKRYLASPIHFEHAFGPNMGTTKWAQVNPNEQAPAHMPAYQWVVLKKGFQNTFTNREYPTQKHALQVYKNPGAKYYYVAGGWAGADSLEIIQIKDAADVPAADRKAAYTDPYLGYKKVNPVDYAVKQYLFKYLHPYAMGENAKFIGTKANQVLNVLENKNAYRLLDKDPVDAAYGFPVTDAVKKAIGIVQLVRSEYAIKVKNASVAQNTELEKYQLQNVAAADMIYFYLKENNYVENENYYAVLQTVATPGNNNIEDNKFGVTDDMMDASIKIQDIKETRTSAFAIYPDETPLYRRFNNTNLGESATDGRDTLRFVESVRKEYLMDENNREGGLMHETVNYAGMWTADKATGLGFRIDTAWVNRGLGYIKPQYLISVAHNDFEGYTPECECMPGIAGFERAKYLVSFQDSVDTYGWDKPYADVIKGYTRVGFVEGVRVADTLWILPAKLRAVENKALMAEIKKFGVVGNLLSGDNHKNYTWSFRYVHPENAPYKATEEGEVNRFLFESNNYDGLDIAPENAAWIKIQNGCVVLTDNKSTFSSAKTGGDGALIFNVENLADDTLATDNETIAAAEVAVVAEKAAVRILNAEGKKVVVSNILGQTIANTVVTSSDATIAAPAGVVVVAVEGEAAVKAIVK